MNKFYFVAGVFLFFALLLPFVAAWSWLSFTRLKKRGKVEDLLARAQVSKGVERGQQVRLIVEMKDQFGDPIELQSRSTSSDWIALDGNAVTVVYDPADPQSGWMLLDYRRRQKVIWLMSVVLAAIGGIIFLVAGSVG